MAIADMSHRNLYQYWCSWCHRLYRLIPESWFLNEIDNRDNRDNRDSRYREDLDDTRSFRRRYEDSPNNPPPSPKVQVPFGVIISLAIWMVGQLVAGVWWAATLQSNLQHEISDRAKEESRLWDNIQAYRSEVNILRNDIARLTGTMTPRRNKEED